MSNFDSNGLENFLEKIDTVSQQINDLMTGKVSPEQIDQSENEREHFEDYQKRQMEIEKAKWLSNGRPGKGHKGDYVSFCKGCFREFDIFLPKCTLCQSETVTKEEWMTELRGKLEEYKKKTAKRAERKDKWDKW